MRIIKPAGCEEPRGRTGGSAGRRQRDSRPLGLFQNVPMSSRLPARLSRFLAAAFMESLHSSLPGGFWAGLPGGTDGVAQTKAWGLGLDFQGFARRANCDLKSDHLLYSPWGCTESDTTEQLSLHFTSDRTDCLGGYVEILEFLCHKLKLNRFTRSEEWMCEN